MFMNVCEMLKSCIYFLASTVSTLHVSINLRMPLQNRWLKEICTKSSRFMLTNCWTQQLWEICCCSLTWMVMSAPINTTNVCAVWASTWMRTKNIVYWGYLKAILVEGARKNSCYLSVTLHPCDGTRNSSEFVSWSTSSGTEAEGNRAGMGKEWAGTLALSLPELWQWEMIKSPFFQLLFPGKSRAFIKCVSAPSFGKRHLKCWMFSYLLICTSAREPCCHPPAHRSD